jgi:uncharacterized protein YrzB (UPF0473 family)
MENKINTIVMTDETGNQKELTIYFTYHSEKFNKDYVVLYDVNDPDSLIAGIYDNEGNISDIENDEEYDEIEEVIGDFQKSNKE